MKTKKMWTGILAAATTIGLLASSAGATSTRQTSVVFTFAGFNTVGSSTLTRQAGGVTMWLRTSDLTPGDAVTVWWVVFNHPENCHTKIDNPSFPFRCGEPDLSRPDVQASVLYAAGNVIGHAGTAGYGAHLTAGDARGAILGSGLDPAQIDAADIHLVVRDHGPADPALMPDEIHSFNVCNTTCTDVQASVHEAD
jgi:hypothetical protein